MSNVTEISYGNYTENECYFFTYDHVNIDFLSLLFNRTCESIIYQNGRLSGYARIFCNENICSIYESYDSFIYGIIVKITFDELEILKSYYKNYTLDNSLIYCTSSKIAYEKIIEDDRPLYRITNHPSLTPYIFVYNDYINDKQIVPSLSYMNEIRKMLNDRCKIQDCVMKPITILFVKHKNIHRKYQNIDYIDTDVEYYDIKEKKKYETHIILFDYEKLE